MEFVNSFWTVFLAWSVWAYLPVRAERPQVNCSIGSIRGQLKNVAGLEVEEFLGLPYAQPPIGQLRFALPVPYGNVALLEATRFSARCPQSMLGPQPPIAISEDCLYLNVYRRAGTQENDEKAVIVIFHGGAFSIGSGSDPFFYGSPLAGIGDVIVVSFNYRLGILGFADMKGLAPGNLGLFDQRLVLEWIQDHIRAFGGNPRRVTLMGVSAGSMSISAHIMTPLNRVGRQLFHAAVMDAGVMAAGVVARNDLSLCRVRKIADTLGCRPTNDDSHLLPCLRTADVNTLVNLSLDVEGYSPIFTFHPTVDGTFLTRDITEDVRDNVEDFVKVKTLIGYAKDEGSLFAGYYFDFNPMHFPTLDTEEQFLNWCGKLASGYLYPMNLKNEDVRKRVSTEYYQRSASQFLDASAFLADGTFVCPVNNFVRHYSRVNANVYVYRFERKFRQKYFDIDPDVLGVCHISPFIHMIGCMLGLSGSSPNSSAVDVEDRKFFVDAIQMISAFASSDGPPTFRGLEWPRFGEGERLVIFDDKPYVSTTLLSDERCKIVFPFFES